MSFIGVSFITTTEKPVKVQLEGGPVKLWMITMRIRRREEDQKEVLRDKTGQEENMERERGTEVNNGMGHGNRIRDRLLDCCPKVLTEIICIIL